MNAVLGAMVAIVIGVLLLAQEDGGVLDTIGDAFDMLTSTEEDRLARLEPGTQQMVRQLIAEALAAGIRLHIGQTLRTPAEEKAVIAGGKSAVKTHSWHELGRAVDLYPDYAGRPDYDAVDLESYRRFHSIATTLGFRSLAFNDDGTKHLITNAQGKKIWDGGHVEWRSPYGSIAEAVAAEGSAYGIA